MNIIRGKIPCAKKIVVYGPEGIGKSTFASRFPEPLFIDTEGSTKELDVARTPAPTSWTMLKEQIAYVKGHPEICKTLIIDTIDWAEQLCVEDICTSHHKHGIEDFGYGNGYVYVKEEFGRFLHSLEEVIAKGINVVLTAHAQMRKFEQPDELGSYDRWELKLGKKTASQTSPLVKEWADMILFANYKTVAVAVDDKGRKFKAQGGRRVMYTQHHPCWDAKNRYGLPDETDFDYNVIAAIIEGTSSEKAAAPAGVQAPQHTEPAPQQQPPQVQTQQPHSAAAAPSAPVQEPVREPVQAPEPDRRAPDGQMSMNLSGETGGSVAPPASGSEGMASGPVDPPSPPPKLDERIPKALRDLMTENGVSEWDVQMAVAKRGYFTSDVPIWRYDETYPGFVDGALVAGWSQVFQVIKQIWKETEIPF
ncbi:MAG: ATP-binding protein [Eubacteriales bacterium]|nr:ATP-binding protein [Eubacteriales bacterium]